MKRKLYLIGGSGFIGKNLCEVLSHEYDINVFDKYIDEKFFGNHPDIGICQVDLVKDKIPKEYPAPDFIINLASVVTAERDLSLFPSLIETNLNILLNLFERFRNEEALKLFIQFGSSEEYGNEGSPFAETTREQPLSPYALIKQLTTNTAIMLNKNYGFPAMVVRPANLYGEGQNPTKFIPYVKDRLSHNQPLDVTPCEQRRDFIEAKDFAKIIGALLSNYQKCIGEIVNIGSGNSRSLKEIIEYYRLKFKSASTIKYGAIPYRENEVMDLRCDISKLLHIINRN